jgi:hypothetical protein
MIGCYQIVMNGSFKSTIQAIIRFERFDAARFRLRDRLRAEGLAAALNRESSAQTRQLVDDYLVRIKNRPGTAESVN